MPDEGFWVTVVVLDKAADGLFEFFGGAVDPRAVVFPSMLRAIVPPG
jgi:hypothetical protein